MTNFKRRDFLKATAGVAAGGALGAGSALLPADAQAQYKVTPEKGAKLRVLRWKRFVQGDEDAWAENTKKFTQATGIDVRIDAEGWEDVRPKAAVAANVGSGPDIIIGTFEDAHQYPDKLVDVTDLCNYLGGKYGGWYDICKSYCTNKGKWIATPMGAAGACLVYRESAMKAAGFETFPKDTAGFLKLCQGLKAKGLPPGFALGNATGDGNTWCHWVVWSHGGKMVDAKDNVVINSPETIAGLEYAKQLYAAKTSKDEKLQEMAKDINHANFPVGPVGKPTELQLFFPMMIFKYSKYPNAAKEYLRFMMEKEQYVPWQQASIGYVTQPLKAYESNPIWTADPKHTPYRDLLKYMLPNGYAGEMGYASAATMADFIMVNMVAEAASGAKSPKEAAERAHKRAERYYKV